MQPEVLGAVGIGLVAAGAGAVQMWHQLTGNKRNGHHCQDHAAFAQTLTEVKQDVKWLREKQESDATNTLLNGILQHLVRQHNES